jgi:hypothetical protein
VVAIQPAPPPQAAAPRRPDVFERVFTFFSSVKLGVCVLLSCALFFGLSTIFWQEPEVIVKHVAWVKHGFEIVLVFLSLNLFAVTLSRYPWNRLKIGMLVTHAGLIVTFAGAFLTCKFGQDGLITLREGELTDRFYNGRDVLSLKTVSPAGHGLAPYRDFPVPLIGWTRATERDIQLPLEDGTTILIDRYFPHYRENRVWREGPAGGDEHPNPGALLKLSAGGRDHETLLPDYNLAGPALFGPELAVAYLSRSDGEIAKSLSKPRDPPRDGKLVIEPADGERITLDVRDNLGKPTPLAGGYTLTLEQYLPDLVVGEDNKAVSRSDRPENPGIRIRVTGPDNFDQSQWLFPEKETPPMLGRIHLDGTFDFRYDFPERLTFVYVLKGDAAGAQVIVSRPAQEGERTDLAFGRTIELTPGIAMRVLATFERATQVDEPRNDNPNKSPAVHLVWKGGGRQADAWIPFGDTQRLTLGETTLWFHYTQMQAALPFQLRLVDFRIRQYEGSSSPSSFESTVKVGGEGRSEAETLISMNNPLQVPDGWGTWKVFQSSYSLEPEVTSTFSVSYDPGRPIVYAGFIAVCSGVFFMFWVKPFLRKRMEKK